MGDAAGDLRIEITDDGRGGADLGRVSGVIGIKDRGGAGRSAGAAEDAPALGLTGAVEAQGRRGGPVLQIAGGTDSVSPPAAHGGW